MSEQTVKACYPRRSEMTAAANDLKKRFGWEIIRCRMSCEKIPHKDSRRNAVLILNGDIVEAQLMRCKECAIRKEAEDGTV
ncbi:MAG: hypothetical protein LBH92_03950 [Bacteroidales bacterium]|jgi:hypothetical protein|nr:hypothetical protein [Bacteroidales bacterium]